MKIQFIKANKLQRALYLLSVVLIILSHTTGCALLDYSNDSTCITDLNSIPPYIGNAYIEINGNIPYFTEEDYTEDSFEKYGEHDSLGRCTEAYACIGSDLMPDEKRGSIGQIKPSGWHTVKYDIVDGKYLYNRCHLIGYRLSGENANPNNLITGTRYLNTEGMLPFEDKVAEYVHETNNHVLYRVTPVFSDDNLLADGVLMEGYSVEDNGEGITFNVFAYNVQPGIAIDYSDGSSRLDDKNSIGYDCSETTDIEVAPTNTYIININTNKFHRVDCPSVDKIKNDYKETFTGEKSDLIKQGYEPCKNCSP